MADPKTTVPDFLAAEAAEAESEFANLEQEKAAPPEQVEQVPVEQQAPHVPDIDAVDGEDRGQFIRKAALYEERQRRKEATERSREWERRYTEDMRKAQERLQALFEGAQRTMGQAPEAPKAPEVPDINTDPIGHFQAKQEALERELNEAKQWRSQTQQQAQQQEVLQKISAEVSRLEREFAQSTPDYDQAQQHLFKTWASEAELLGVPADEAIRFWSMQIVQRAGQQNKNPAQMAYELSKQRGYQAAQQAQTQTQQSQAPRKAGPNLDTIAKGMATAKSASTTSGTAAAGVPTIEALLAMPEDEFTSKYGSSDNRTWDREMKRIMGIS